MNKKGFIFDLDGVIVDTAKYHYLAWKKLANDLGFEFTKDQNELFKALCKNYEPSGFLKVKSTLVPD